MKRYLILAAASAASVTVTGCLNRQGTMLPANAAGLTWTAHLTPTVATGTRISGDARVTPAARPDRSRIVLEVIGGAIAGRHPWAIRSGMCQELVPVDLGGRAMYPPLALSTDGSGRVSIELPVVVPTNQRYHIAVFASATDRDLVVSCGELRPVT